MAELVMSPVLEQQGRFRCNTPVPRVRELPPLIDVPANHVHRGGDVVLLLCRRQTLPFVQDQLLLPPTTRPPPLSRLGYGRDELSPPASFDDLLGWLARLVQLPMARGIVVGRVQYRVVQERISIPCTAGLIGYLSPDPRMVNLPVFSVDSQGSFRQRPSFYTRSQVSEGQSLTPPPLRDCLRESPLSTPSKSCSQSASLKLDLQVVWVSMTYPRLCHGGFIIQRQNSGYARIRPLPGSDDHKAGSARKCRWCMPWCAVGQPFSP